MKPSMSEIALADTPRRTVIIDIDGTIIPDGETQVAEPEREALARLARSHDVYLCSNNVDPVRSKAIAASVGLPLLDSVHRKPDARLVEGITLREPLVIGDKFLTDERFARRIRAEFIKVTRLTSPSDGRMTRWIYALDDAAAVLMNVMKRLV